MRQRSHRRAVLISAFSLHGRAYWILLRLPGRLNFAEGMSRKQLLNLGVSAGCVHPRCTGAVILTDRS